MTPSACRLYPEAEGHNRLMSEGQSSGVSLAITENINRVQQGSQPFMSFLQPPVGSV